MNLQPRILAPETTTPANAVAIAHLVDTHKPPIAPAQNFLTVVPNGTTGVVNPVANVPEYLRTRAPVQFWEDEEPLFVKLPGEVRRKVKMLQAVAELVWALVKAKSKVEPACLAAITSTKAPVSFKTFRNQYDAWVKAKDWLVFVNRSKAGAEWQERADGLPAAFLDFCAARIGQYKREDARKEALRSIKRQWLTGRTFEGREEGIPGYGFARDWWRANCKPVGSVPSGWHYSNLMRQIKAKNVLPMAARMLLLQGTAAAKEFVPDVLGETKMLRFLEEVQFDDVKTDWRVFDPATGQPMDLWLLIARDRATRMLLGFGMRPARVREDGSQEHLKLRDMKQLCAWLLERYGLPPYLMVWKIERGTATLSEGSVAALQEMLGAQNIRVAYSSMVGRTSPAGYFEKRIGNSKGKASLESHNRGIHLIGASIAGQTGPSYGQRPADLTAREKECVEIAYLSEFLPPHVRGQMGYSLLTLGQARQALFQIFTIQNHRDDHTMEGFEEVVECYCPKRELWLPQNCFVDGMPTKRRMEKPVERAVRLMAGHQFTPVSPDILTEFLEHTERTVTVGLKGEIVLSHESKTLVFVDPNGAQLPEGTKLLAYFHPDDPAFLHLTDGKGAIVGTWLQRGRVRNNDTDAIAQAMAYQAAKLKAAADRAEELNAPERAALEAMRASNAELLRLNEFVEIAECGVRSAELKTSTVATGLRSIKRRKAEVKAEKRNEEELAELATSSLLKVEPKLKDY